MKVIFKVVRLAMETPYGQRKRSLSGTDERGGRAALLP